MDWHALAVLSEAGCAHQRVCLKLAAGVSEAQGNKPTERTQWVCNSQPDLALHRVNNWL